MARVCLHTGTSSHCQVYSWLPGTGPAYNSVEAMKASSNAGPERFVLGQALLVPLVLGALALAQLPGASLASPASLLLGDAGTHVMSRRPAPSDPAPPPTLVAPTATAVTPRPTP